MRHRVGLSSPGVVFIVVSTQCFPWCVWAGVRSFICWVFILPFGLLFIVLSGFSLLALLDCSTGLTVLGNWGIVGYG